MLPNADQCIGAIDNALRTLHGVYSARSRANPAAHLEDADFSEEERQHISGLIRIDHVGEICAQALYQGQALTARDEPTRRHMLEAAAEETDHLAWCDERLKELDSHTSLFNPLWYTGSFVIGAAAGLAGDGWNLGFVVETEKQVEAHLDDHLEQLPEKDHRSHAILQQMKDDEVRHAVNAQSAGGKPLPQFIRESMKLASKVMTLTAYRL